MKKYDIFISYRHDSTAAKAEHLQSLLSYAGFAERVSFDKDNLRSRFDIELLRRIDECKDFVVVLGENSLNGLKSEDTEHYKKLALCSIEEFTVEEMKLEHTDFVRLEIARAMAMGKNIIPVVPETTDSYCFFELNLPEDISLIKKYQAIFYSDRNDSFMFKDIMPKLLNKLISLPDATPSHSSSRSSGIKRSLWWCVLGVLLAVLVSGLCFWLYDSRKDKFLCDEILDGVPVNWVKDISLKQLQAVHEIVDDMEFLQGGTYMMGASPDENGDFEECVDSLFETPQLLQTVGPFYICKYEVTIGQWGRIMGQKYDEESSMLPKTDVTYLECKDFLDRLMVLTGLEFSLPTEAEWEYAARGGDMPDNTKYSGTDDPCRTGWTPSAAGPYMCEASASGRYANGADLFDMSSNVSEWCDTPFRLYRDIVSGTSLPEVLDADAMVIRGGNYMSEPCELTVTHRDTLNKNSSMPTLGLRLVFRKIVW